jgi:hypothetical protein
MNLTTLVDVAIGLSIVYLGASLFVTIVNEYLAQLLSLRARQLGKNLKKLIDGPEGIAALKANPALAPFFRDGGFGGSYVDPTVVAQHLVGGLRTGATGAAAMKDIVQAINAMQPSNLKTQLLAISQAAGDKVGDFVHSVSTWFDNSLTMMGETYKKRTQIYSFVIGLAIAIIFNLDTLGIATHLYHDKEAREAISAVGAEIVQKTPKETFDKCMKKPEEERRKDSDCAGVYQLIEGIQLRNETLGKLPIGWPATQIQQVPLALTLPFGWLLTALAISLGASFWFDLLNRLVNMRHGMRKPEVKDKES